MSAMIIGPYRQQDQWGKKCLSFIKHFVDTNWYSGSLCIRPLYYNITNPVKDIGDLEQYEYNQLESKDVLYQFALPMTLNYNGDFDENVAVTMVDSRIDHMGWTEKLNMFDEIIVFSEVEEQLLLDSGVTAQISVLDLKEENLAPIAELGLHENYFNNTTFYTDAPCNDTSGLREILEAYLSSYSITDKVTLFVFSQENEKEQLAERIESTKKRLAIYKDQRNYPDISIIGSREDAVVNYGHDKFDCYIYVGYGGKLPRQAKVALQMNKPSIVLDTVDIDDKYPFYAKTSDQICLTSSRPMFGINAGINSWKTTSSFEVARVMKLVNSETLEECKQYILKSNTKEKACTQ